MCSVSGCAAPPSTTDTCTDSYPVDCGSYCCPTATYCGSNETCVATASTPNETTIGMCPPSHPVDCGGSFCCPSGSVCDGDQCQKASETLPASDVTCSSQSMSTDVGSCSLEFCIANYDTDCESYYVVNGQRISCNECAADTDCVQAAATACTASIDTPADPTPTTDASSSCCTSANACSWANDGVCDCDGAFGWDNADCSPPEAACSINALGQPSPPTTPWTPWLLLAGVLLLQRRRS